MSERINESQSSPMHDDCGNCHRCLEEKKDASGWPVLMTRMIVCPTCGNKRCPKASDHRLKCSGSNEPGQPGSVFEAPRPKRPANEDYAVRMVRRALDDFMYGSGLKVGTKVSLDISHVQRLLMLLDRAQNANQEQATLEPVQGAEAPAMTSEIPRAPLLLLQWIRNNIDLPENVAVHTDEVMKAACRE